MGDYDIATVAEARVYLRLTDADIQQDAISVYCSSDTATAATVEVTISDLYAATVVLAYVGEDAGTVTTTYALSAADSDTVGGLANTINNTDGWTADLLSASSYPASDLNLRGATPCLTSDNEVTLTVEDQHLLAMVIEQGTDMIEGELGYGVADRPYAEFHSGDGGRHLWLENVPVIAVNEIGVGRAQAMTVTYDGGDASFARAGIFNDTLRMEQSVAGTKTRSDFYLSDTATLTALVAAIDARTGWDAAAVTGYGNYSPSDLIAVPARNAKDATVEFEVPDPGEDDCEIEDEDTGRLYNPRGWVRGHKNIFIKYDAGYTSIPPGLQSACLEVLKLLYDLAKKDASLKSEKIGDYSYTVADRLNTVFSVSGATQTSNLIAVKLAPHKRVLLLGVG